jgi:hypothetical protein
MKVFRKGIIRGIPLDCSIEEIKEGLNKSNPGLRVSEVSRLKRRVQKDGETEWADTLTVSIVVRSKVTKIRLNLASETGLGTLHPTG